MANFAQDLRYAIRVLIGNPGFTLAAVIALALGSGANTAVFSVVNAVLLRPLPYREPGRVVIVWSTSLKNNRPQEPISVPDLLDYRSQNSLFEGLACLSYDDFNLSTGGESEHVQGSFVSANFFSVLGVTPQLGRTFTGEEDQPGAGRVAVISDGLWKRQFGGAPGVLNREIRLNGTNFTVIGVAPPDFLSPEKTDQLWIAMSMDGGDRLRVPSSVSPEDLAKRRIRFLRCVGRLQNGASLEHAQAEMATIASRLEQQYPESNSGFGVNLVPAQAQIVGDIGSALELLLAVVGLVLLIACANVANLLLARGAARQKEIAVRTALGASRARLLRQLLTENILLAVIAGAAGLLLAYLGIEVLVAINPANIPRLNEINIDPRVLGFTLIVSLATGLIFGLLPAAQLSKPDLNQALKEGARGSSEGGGRRLRNVLVILEIALTQMLLIAAALTLKSFYNLQNVDPGFNPDRVLTMQVALPPLKYSEDSQIAAFFEQALGRIAALPGVQAAGAATTLPLQPDTALARRFTIDGRPPSSPNERLTASYRAVSPDFFKVMGIRLAGGRFFTDGDRDKSPPVIIINKAMKRHYWGDGDPLGKHISITAEGGVSREVVGVVDDVKQTALNGEAAAEMYEPYLQFPWSFMAIVVRASNDPVRIAPAVRGEVIAIDPAQAVFDIKPMSQIVGESISQPRLYTVLLAIFAVVALTLAAIGIYGVMSYSVNQRRQEIGIRMALGANQADIRTMVVGHAMLLATAGLVLGVIAAWLLSVLIEHLLYAVSPRDLATYALIPLLLALVSLVSSYIPARRATRVDPVIALRAE